MASLVLSGDTSGSITVSAPAVAGSTTQTLVNVTGTLAPVVSGTAITLTNQTAPEFTGIPSWVKRITVMFSGVSTNGTSLVQVQIGSSSFSTSGYTSQASFSNAATCFITATTGFAIEPSACGSATNNRHGFLVLTLITGNTWVASGAIGSTLQQGSIACSGTSPALGGTLDRIRITTVNGTDTFDAGTINILFE
jgi:hypothetical protein